MRNIYIILLLTLSLSFVVSAEDETENLPRKGTLAASSTTNFDPSVDAPVNITTEEKNPLLASVQKISDREFSYTLKNNSEDSFSTSLMLVAYDKNGKRVKNSPASVSLRAGESVTRTLRAGPGAHSLQVELRDFKKKEKEVSAEELSEAIAEKKAELSELQNQLAEANKK